MTSSAPEIPDPEDARTIAALSVRYGDAVRRYFNRRLGGGAESEDLTQEVFVRLLRRARLDQIDNIEGYLFHTAANLLRERSRQRIRRRMDAQAPIEDDFDDAFDELSPERILLGRETYRRMVEALQELPERVRTVFVLNRFEDMAGAQIARHLGVGVSTVEKDMMRAVAHLRARLR